MMPYEPPLFALGLLDNLRYGSRFHHNVKQGKFYLAHAMTAFIEKVTDFVSPQCQLWHSAPLWIQ